MENVTTRESANAEFAPSLFDRVKRVFANVGVFFDVKGYKKEMAQYQNELKDGHG